MADLLSRRSASTAATRCKGLRVLYPWLEEEEEIPNPMARMRPPIVPEQPMPVVPDDGLRRLLATCAGKDFRCPPRHCPDPVLPGHRRPSKRGRRPQLADLDFDYQVTAVLGKGRRTRELPFGRRPRSRWIATFAHEPSIATPIYRGCGLGSAAGSPPTASNR